MLVLALFGLGYAALSSSAVRARIERSLSQSLGRPVTMGGISVGLFPAPALDARDVRIGDADTNSAPGLSLISVHVVPRVSSFLPGRTVTIDRIDLRAVGGALATIEPYPDLTISGKAPFELTTTIAPDFKTFVATGRASIQRVKFGTLTLDAMSSPFRFEKGVFTLDPCTFTFYGGKQKGTVRT